MRVGGWAAAGVFTLCAAAGCAGTPSEPGWGSGGPMLTPPEHTWFVTRDPGDTFTDGLERLRLDGTVDGVVDRVELVMRGGDEDAVELVGALVAGEDRKVGSWQLSDGFPPEKPGKFGPLVEADGAPLPAGGLGSLLLVGMRPTGTEYAVRDGVNVYYTVDGDRYVTFLPASVVFCPPSGDEDDCVAKWEAEND